MPDKSLATRLILLAILLCTLVLTPNDGEPAHASETVITAAGFGSTPPPPGPINFGEVVMGTSKQATFVIFNTGDETLTVQDPLLGGWNPGDFSIATFFPVNIPAGNHEIIYLYCNPTGPGARTASLWLTTNDPANPSVKFNLQCTGLMVLTPGPVETGIEGPYDLAASPDGNHVYATSLLENTLVTLTRDKISGALNWILKWSTGELIGPNGVAVSPDGEQVFVTSYGTDTLFILDRLESGMTMFSDKIQEGDMYYCQPCPPCICFLDGLEGANGLAVSPDSTNIYVAATEDDALTVFSRTVPTGTVSYVQDLHDSDLGVAGLDGALDIAISPDGYHVYVASAPSSSQGGGGSVAVFSRSRHNQGRLTYKASYYDGGGYLLDRPSEITVNPDGSQVYVVSYFDDTLMVFDRNPADGTLTIAESFTDGVGGVDGLARPYGIATNRNGTQLYVSSTTDDALAVFDRYPYSGWQYVTHYQDGVDDVDGLDWACKVATTPDGKHVYVSGYMDNKIASFGIVRKIYLPATLR